MIASALRHGPSVDEFAKWTKLGRVREGFSVIVEKEAVPERCHGNDRFL
jgi:hypothetical protein